jgi:hypothetical protein
MRKGLSKHKLVSPRVALPHRPPSGGGGRSLEPLRMIVTDLSNGQGGIRRPEQSEPGGLGESPPPL